MVADFEGGYINHFEIHMIPRKFTNLQNASLEIMHNLKG